MGNLDWDLILEIITSVASVGLLIGLIQGSKTLRMAVIISTRDKFSSIHDTLIDHPDLVPMYRGNGVQESDQTAEREYALALKYFEALTAIALLRKGLPKETKPAFPNGLRNLLPSDRLKRLWEELKEEYPDVTGELIKKSDEAPAST
ncbi:MAG: hypothetical protein ACYDH4_12150 [Candidatus Cryosericum sp.]